MFIFRWFIETGGKSNAKLLTRYQTVASHYSKIKLANTPIKSVVEITYFLTCVILFPNDALLNTKHKALLLKIERTTSGVNLAVWPVLVTGGDPARQWPVATVTGSCSGLGLGQESLSQAGPVIRHQRHTSILAIVLRHHRTFHQVTIKWCGKNLFLRVWVSWDGIEMVYVSSQGLWSSQSSYSGPMLLVVRCHGLAGCCCCGLTDSVSRCYTAAHLTVGWLGLCDEAVKKLVNSQAFSRFRK